MDLRTLFSKIIPLIYRTRALKIFENDDLIRTILNTIKTDKTEYTFSGYNYFEELKKLSIELLEEKEEIAKEAILDRLKIILENDQKLFNTIKESLEAQYDDASIKRIITSNVKMLNNFYKEHIALEIINKVSYDLRFNRAKIANFNEYLKNVIAELEPLTMTSTNIKDPAIVNEIDFENTENLDMVFEEVKKINSTTGVYKTGWQAINRMTQGGIRRGEFVMIGALQHKYKTGFTLSLFMQIARHNKPVITPDEQDKKPLLLRISFEDSLTSNLQFMYQYLKAHDGEFIKPKDFDNLDTKEMSRYIVSKLTETGFHIKLLRVDPSQWSYASVINKILELEAQGYAIHVLMLDYITLLPTVGCTQGPAGTDKRDLVRRIRNFCSSRNISVITPVQLSTEAKQLIRNGIPEDQFVKKIVARGYFDSCKTLDQEADLLMLIHLFSHKRQKWLSVQLDKHRLPTVVDEDDRYCLYKFPMLNVPILEDLEGDDSSFKKLPREEGQSDSLINELFG